MTRPLRRAPRSVTLLHLSDPQFGAYHREPEGGTPADRDQQSLRGRLLEDLAKMEREHGARADLVVVTGDLSERASAVEMEGFEAFAVGLLEGLGLPRERLVLVPGNHDVSWSRCRFHFDLCEEDGREPVAPFWPKWETYAALFGRIYGGPEARFEFREGRAYSLFEHEDLHTVVAGLNSTMLESHRKGDHYGHVGTDQLRWFEDQLRPYRDRGWLRIVAVHHNVMGGASPDENLRDADELKLRLGGLANLVVHGHTHDGKLQWLSPGVPVASTGSAAVVEQARPHGVPCQYQLLRVEPGRLRQWTRAYQEAQGRWVGDVAASPDGDRWEQEHTVAFVDLHGVFPPEDPDDETEEPPRFDPRGARRGDEPMASEHEGFLARVAEVCRLRQSHAEVHRRHKGPPTIEYLELRRPEGEHVEVVPIGVSERGASPEMLRAFVERVVPAYRRHDPGVRPIFVYGGPPASAEAEQHAREAGVWLRSYEQHCGLIDFRRYRQRLADRLARDRVYPPSRYVVQRMVERVGVEDVRHEDALATVRGWLDGPLGHFVLVLGTFGCGKTFLLRELARRLAEEEGAIIPILVEMRSLEKGLRLEQLLAQHFALHEVDDYSPARFMRMLEDGRVVLLFDGFDELVVRTTYPRAAEHFETIVSAARGRAKVVVSSRRQHFYSDLQAKQAVRQVLMQKVETVPGHRVVTLQPFEDDQIERFLVGQLGEPQAAHERMRLIAEVRDLGGLSTNPRMLGFIAALSEDDLRAARDQEGSVSAASLYRTLLQRWLDFENERRHPRGAPPGLSTEQRWVAVTRLAVRLWTSGEHHVGVAELEELGAVLTELAKTSTDEAGFQIGSGTLLVRDEEGHFSFIHESVMEWLVASAGAEALRSEERPELLDQGKMSPLLADFLIDLAGEEAVQAWCARSLSGGEGSNALLVRGRLLAAGLEPAEPRPLGVDLRGQELRGRDLSGQMLVGAGLSGADLSRASLRRADLRRARLDGAMLGRADLGRADLREADLHEADLRRAAALGVDLRGADLRATDLRRAKLLGARVDRRALEPARTEGAALPGSPLRAFVSLPFLDVRAMAASSDGELLAIADGSTLRLWDAVDGTEIGRTTTDQLELTALAIDAETNRIALGGNDGRIHLWSGPGEMPVLERQHPAAIVGLCFHRSRLRSVSADGTRADGERSDLVRPRRSYPISAFTSSADGSTIALGSYNGGIELLGLHRRARWNRQHPGPVASITLSPDGEQLAWVSRASNVVVIARVEGGDPRLVPVGSKDPVTRIEWVDADELLACTAGGVALLVSPSLGSTRTLGPIGGNPTATATFEGDLLIGTPWSVRAFSRSDAGTYDGRRLNTTTPQSVRAIIVREDSGLLLHHGALTVRVDPSLRVEAESSFLFEDEVLLTPDGQAAVAVHGLDLRVYAWPSRPDQGPSWREHELTRMPMAVTTIGRSAERVLVAIPSAGDHLLHLQEIRIEADGSATTEHRGTTDGADLLASSPDGRWFGVARPDLSLSFFSPLSRTALAPPLVLEGHRARIVSLALSDEPLAISGDESGTVLLWDLHAGKLRHRFELPFRTSVVAFGPQGSVVAATTDGQVGLWRADSGEAIAGAPLHDAPVTALAFVDDQTLATGSADGTVELWRLPSFEPLATLAILAEGWAAFAPDGRYKTGGRVAGELWHAAGQCRFEVGELDEVLPELRIAPDASILDLT